MDREGLVSSLGRYVSKHSRQQSEHAEGRTGHDARKQKKDACPQETQMTAQEEVEEGSAPLEGQCVQNAAGANPPGPPGLVLKNEVNRVVGF